MPLTRLDMSGGPLCHIVGVRDDGSRLILETYRRREKAEARCAELARQLEGYSEIVVESEVPSEFLNPFQHKAREGMKAVIVNQPNGEPAAPKGVEDIKQAHRRLQEQKAKPLPTPGQAVATPKRGAIAQLVRELDADTSWEQFEAEAKKRGLQVEYKQWYGACWTARKIAESGVTAKPKPKPAPKAEPKLAPAAARPSKPTTAPALPPSPSGSIEAFTELALAVARVGGIEAARRHLETLEIIEQSLKGA